MKTQKKHLTNISFCSNQSLQENTGKQTNRTKNTPREGKMKNKALILAAMTAALAASSGHQSEAQSTAVTKSYGYLELINNGEAHNALPFHRREAYQGRVASVSGSTITLQGTPGFTASQFVFALPAQTNEYYLMIRSGASEGEFFKITGNTANTLTVSSSMVGVLSANDIIAVVPKWSLSTLFPNGAGVHNVANYSSLQSGTGVFMFTPNNNVSTVRAPIGTGLYYNGSNWRLGPTPQLRDHTITFNPTDAYVIRHHANSPLNQIKEGWVEESSVAIMVQRDPSVANLNVFGLPRPLDYTPAQVGLAAVNNNIMTLLSYGPNQEALMYVDNATPAFPKAPVATGIWLTSSNDWRIGPTPMIVSNMPLFKAGRAVYLRRMAGTTNTSDIINEKNW